MSVKFRFEIISICLENWKKILADTFGSTLWFKLVFQVHLLLALITGVSPTGMSDCI